MAAPKADNQTLKGLTISSGEICELVGITKQSLASWCHEGMPKAGHGQYPAFEAVQWILARARSGDADGAMQKARLRLVDEQRRGHEIENARRESELLPADQVETDLLAFCGVIAGQLDALPQRLAARVAAVDDPVIVQRMLTDECRQLRTAASEAFAAYGVGLEGGGDPGRAPKAQRRRVGRRAPDPANRQPGAGAVAD